MFGVIYNLIIFFVFKIILNFIPFTLSLVMWKKSIGQRDEKGTKPFGWRNESIFSFVIVLDKRNSSP
jgi:uncharacterized membrane protein